MTTPTQLAKYREDFEKTETNPYLEKTVLGMYAVTSIENRWQGYLRAKQETEQAIKDVEKLKVTAINLIAASEEREGDDGERCYLVPAQEFDDLQELLND